jgi:hypothetical protein
VVIVFEPSPPSSAEVIEKSWKPLVMSVAVSTKDFVPKFDCEITTVSPDAAPLVPRFALTVNVVVPALTKLPVSVGAVGAGGAGGVY